MKKVLLIVSDIPKDPTTSLNWTTFKNLVEDPIKDRVSLEVCALTELVFIVNNAGSRVFVPAKGFDIGDFDMVIFRKVGSHLDLAVAAANYLRKLGIPFIDGYLPEQGSGKLASSLLRQLHNLPTPTTIYGPTREVINAIKDSGVTYPLIVKADEGRKGRDNYLAKNVHELEAIIRENPGKRFVVQEFIANDGDYRVLVLAGKIELVIKRSAVQGSHLNNTSQGGKAELAEVSIFSDDVQADIIKAAEVEKLQVAGVDIIFDKRDGKHYFLEVNRAPQLGTGASADKKLAAYSAMIARLVKD